MAHMSSFSINNEIIEIEDDDLSPPELLKAVHHPKSEMRTEQRNQRSPASNLERISSLEHDLNQIFEIFNRRPSPHQNGAGPSKKNNSKRPVRVSSSSSSNGFGNSEKVNLKQALRGLCISQASEMAAKRRSSKTGGSSEAGRIMTMHRNLVVEESPTVVSQDNPNGGLLEISIAPKANFENSFHGSPESPVVIPDGYALNHFGPLDRELEPTLGIQRESILEPSNARGDREKCSSISSFNPKPSNNSMPKSRWNSPVQNFRFSTSNETESRSPLLEMSPKESPVVLLTSPPSPGLNPSNNSMPKSGWISPVQKFRISTSDEAESRSSLLEMSPKEIPDVLPTSPPYPTTGDNLQKGARKCLMENALFYVSDECPSQTSLSKLSLKDNHVSNPLKLHSNEQSPAIEIGESVNLRTASPASSLTPGSRPMIVDEFHKEDHLPPPCLSTPHYSDDLSCNNARETSMSCAAPNLPVNEESMVKQGLVIREQGLASTTKSEDKGLDVREGQKDGARSVYHNENVNGKSANGVSRLLKPVIRTKKIVKKSPHDAETLLHSSLDSTHGEFNNILYPGPNHIVCPQCHCVLTEAREQVEGNDGDLQRSPLAIPTTDFSPSSPLASPDAEVSPLSPSLSPSRVANSGYILSDPGTPSYKVDNISMPQGGVGPRGRKSPKSSDKGDFTQSSKSSPDECSTSSEDSNLSRPSFCDRPHMSKDVKWQAIRQVRTEHVTVGLRNFNLLKKLGCGDIGTVYLAELIGTDCLFAIKVMDNDYLARRKKITRAQTEREILRMLDHPFLPTLYCQFTSDNLSCLVMEYCPGGDLHVLRQRQPARCFTEQAARFYVAEVLLALEYLHMLGVVYRDLKPENILVREDGHIMLSDFDLSLRCSVNPTLVVSPRSTTETTTKTGEATTASSAAGRCAQPLCIQRPSCRVSCFGPRSLPQSATSKPRTPKPEAAVDQHGSLPLLVAEPVTARSNSFVGTHEYLAPEIIKGEGHGSAVDWWTLGIFLYELLYGRTPFRGAGNEETLANVVMQSLKFPDSPIVCLQARDLMVGLLVKNPEGRLGTLRGAAEIKQHSFFEGLNWALIRCAVPPQLPEFGKYSAKGYSHDKGNGNDNMYLEYNASTGEHLEFEVF